VPTWCTEEDLPLCFINVISRLELRTDPLVVRRAWNLLERSFPKSECVDQFTFEEVIRNGSKQLWTDADGWVLAVTCGLRSPVHQVLLEYLAVEPLRRSSGLGSMALRLLAEKFASPIVFEMDVPDAAQPDTVRRLEFYEKFGAARIAHSCGYCMPDLASERLVPMWLMDLVPGRRRRPLSAGQVVALVEDIWRRSYGRSEGDARFKQVLANVRRTAKGE
jgi:Acetyltransferase (GNAT) family